MQARERIIVALDVDNLDDAKRHIEALSPHVGYFKVGLELITAAGGPAVVAAVRAAGGKVMFDAKFHDIPATMAGAARSAVHKLGVDLFTVHASASEQGLAAVADAVGGEKAIGVTVLTSMTDAQCMQVYGAKAETAVLQFAYALAFAGIKWIVCSPKELPALSKAQLPLKAITPGVRPAWADVNDQKRVMTPAEAVKAGAQMLVIGRPILKPPPSVSSPVEAAKRIADEIAGALQ